MYTDFSKGSDKLNHDILNAKLINIGVNGDLIRWFSFYLSNRSQIVSVNRFHSPPHVTISGVP